MTSASGTKMQKVKQQLEVKYKNHLTEKELSCIEKTKDKENVSPTFVVASQITYLTNMLQLSDRQRKREVHIEFFNSLKRIFMI